MQLESRLRAFAALAREGSFSRAAASLYVTQPAVSKHVALLEAELGRQLVLRAEALLANAQRALDAAADEDSGTLAVTASGIPGTYLLPIVFAHFHERYPSVEID